jgi:hypothetical protein
MENKFLTAGKREAIFIFKIEYKISEVGCDVCCPIAQTLSDDL